MSTIIIVSVCAAVAAIIGLRVYFEYKEEKEFEKLKQQVEEDRKNAARFIQEEVLAANQPIAIEETPQNQPKVDTPNPAIIDMEPINSAVAEAELKPKKKRRYYGKKKAAIKAKPKKQNKN